MTPRQVHARGNDKYMQGGMIGEGGTKQELSFFSSTPFEFQILVSFQIGTCLPDENLKFSNAITRRDAMLFSVRKLVCHSNFQSIFDYYYISSHQNSRLKIISIFSKIRGNIKAFSSKT
uniref:Uncharacterized protein n=1 Tax=Cacopsylla melanoneura TaxID=428564 RepID=A0A8D8TRK0_9HEMI